MTFCWFFDVISLEVNVSQEELMRVDSTLRCVGYIVVTIAFVAAVAILLPWDGSVRRNAWETKHNTFDFQPMDKVQAMSEIRLAMDRTLSEIPNATADTVYQNFKLLVLLREGPHEELKKDHAIAAAVHQLGQLNIQNLDSQDDRLKIRDEVSKRREADAQFIALDHPQETIWHWDVLNEHVFRMVPFSLVFVVIGFVGLFHLWGFAKLVRVVGCTLSFLFSVAGGAVAQTVKKAEGKKGKQESEHTLQIDARTSLLVSEGPPNPNLFLRVTETRPKGLVESISSWSPRSRNWSTEVAGGWWVPKTGKSQVLAMAVVADDKSGSARFGLGTQIYRRGKLGFFALPVLRWERSIHGPPAHSFTIVANPNIRVGFARWTVAPDVSLKKVQGRPWSWTIGAGLRFYPGGKRQYETGILGNSGGIVWVRPRLITSLVH